MDTSCSTTARRSSDRESSDVSARSLWRRDQVNEVNLPGLICRRTLTRKKKGYRFGLGNKVVLSLHFLSCVASDVEELRVANKAKSDAKIVANRGPGGVENIDKLVVVDGVMIGR